MSVRENIELYGLTDEEQYVEILIREFGAAKHSIQEDTYMLEGLPFYTPRLADDHLLILSFNNVPLPDSLVEALVSHPELFADDVIVRWTQEQDLRFEATLEQLRGRLANRQLPRRRIRTDLPPMCVGSECSELLADDRRQLSQDLILFVCYLSAGGPPVSAYLFLLQPAAPLVRRYVPAPPERLIRDV